MVACPFQIPAFEYHKALNPRILKCDFCFDRRKDGALPACVETCPVEALTYGPREELVRVAKDRVKRLPERYVEPRLRRARGRRHRLAATSPAPTSRTSSSRSSGDKPAPGVSESIQHGIFAYFVPPVSLYALLGAIMWIAKHRGEEEEG